MKKDPVYYFSNPPNFHFLSKVQALVDVCSLQQLPPKTEEFQPSKEKYLGKIQRCLPRSG